MQLVSFEELKAMGISFSTQHLNRLIKAGEFPRAIKLGPVSYTHLTLPTTSPV